MNLLQPTKNHRQTQAFGANPNNGIYGPSGHDGVDYGAITSGVIGDPLFAIDEAMIQEVKWNGGYGNCVMEFMKELKLKLSQFTDSINIQDKKSIAKFTELGMVKLVVFGFMGLILMGVMSAIIALVVNTKI